jgi:hypothetical protein
MIKARPIPFLMTPMAGRINPGSSCNWYPSSKPPGSRGTHLDLRVDGVAFAVRRTEAIGGVTVKTPARYPTGDAAYLEWAIMQDPFGNRSAS